MPAVHDRLSVRLSPGLARSRVLGADTSRGEAIFFLDSHCEVNEGWATPLLDALRQVSSAAEVTDSRGAWARGWGHSGRGGISYVRGGCSGVGDGSEGGEGGVLCWVKGG